jgi:hypothetical protein
VRQTFFPDDWIKPGEFCFIDNGTLCRLGEIEDQGPVHYMPAAREISRINEDFRRQIAQLRKDAGLRPLYWMYPPINYVAPELREPPEKRRK